MYSHGIYYCNNNIIHLPYRESRNIYLYPKIKKKHFVDLESIKTNKMHLYKNFLSRKIYNNLNKNKVANNY